MIGLLHCLKCCISPAAWLEPHKGRVHQCNCMNAGARPCELLHNPASAAVGPAATQSGPACLQLQLGTRQPTVAPRRLQCAHFISRPRLIAASTFRSVPLSVSNTCGGGHGAWRRVIWLWSAVEGSATSSWWFVEYLQHSQSNGPCCSTTFSPLSSTARTAGVHTFRQRQHSGSCGSGRATGRG